MSILSTLQLTKSEVFISSFSSLSSPSDSSASSSMNFLDFILRERLPKTFDLFSSKLENGNYKNLLSSSLVESSARDLLTLIFFETAGVWNSSTLISQSSGSTLI